MKIMIDKVSELYWEIMGARVPRDVFGIIYGNNNAERLAYLEKIYQELVREIDPGAYIDNLDNRARAIEANGKLNQLYEMAKQYIATGTYETALAKPIIGTIESPNGNRYELMEKMAEAERYNLYACRIDVGRIGMLKIAKTVMYNGELDREAFILERLKTRAREIEEEYAEVKTDPKDILNYDLQFPELVESFICQQQGNRRINILAFKDVPDARRLKPLSGVTKKERKRIDLRTSVWIMGKLLKLLVLTFGECIAINMTSGNNILIEPDQHYVLIFDWTMAKPYSDEIPMEIRALEIAQAAQAVRIAIGADRKGAIEDPSREKGFDRYVQYLDTLAAGNESVADRAHERFYAIARSFWGREFHPFTTFSL